MKNGRYLISRDNVYVGKVIDTTCVCKESDCKTLCPGPFLEYRTMIFVLTKDKLADDLLYDSTNYPILNITPKDVVTKKAVSTKHGVLVIHKAYNLGKVLEHFGYDEKLNMIDVVKIRRTILSNNFAEKHCRDFGYTKLENGFGYASWDTRNPIFEMFAVLKELCNSSSILVSPFDPRTAEGKPRKLIRPKGDNIPTKK